MDQLDFKQKYIKYKLKYLKLKNQLGGVIPEAFIPYIIKGDDEYIIYLNKANLSNSRNIIIPEYYQLQQYDGDCQLISVNNFLQKHEYSHLNLYEYLNLFYDNFENIVKIIQQIKKAWNEVRGKYKKESNQKKYDGLTGNFRILFDYIIDGRYKEFKEFTQESKDERIKMMFDNIYDYTIMKPSIFSTNEKSFLTNDILMLLMFRRSENSLFFHPFGNFHGDSEYEHFNIKDFIDSLIKTNTKNSYPIIMGETGRTHTTTNYLFPTYRYKQEHYLNNIKLQPKLDVNSFFKLKEYMKIEQDNDYTFLLNDNIYPVSNIDDMILDNIYLLYKKFFNNLSSYIGEEVIESDNESIMSINSENSYDYDWVPSDADSDGKNESGNSRKESFESRESGKTKRIKR